MIIVFILLGLGFLCGGVAAIVDGLPYMVLERGFTQVIIGTVVAVAGVLMLALSWVLVEFRRLKQTLSSAAMAMSVASAFGGPASERDVALPDAALRPDDAPAGTSSGALAGIGALAGAGAGLVATQALGAAQQPADKPAEPDLFGGDTIENAQPHATEASHVPEAAREADVDALPAFEPMLPVDPQGEPDFGARTETSDAEVEPVPAAALASEPAATDESERDQLAITLAGQDRSDDREPEEAFTPDDAAVAAVPGPSDIDDPFAPELVSPTARAPEPAREADEFGMLRASLTALQMDMEPTGRRIEPSFSGIGGSGSSSDETGRSLDDLAAAGNWMEPALQRRAPWFGETAETPREDAPHGDTPPAAQVPPETAPEPAWPETRWPEPAWSVPAPEPEALPWPPQAREAAAFESEPAALADEPAREQADVEEVPSFASDLAPATADIPEPAAPEADAAEPPANPEASDEGIVGAYQVGEAHFTIYADGSIQARTPDGDYSFTSMDELKIYLASEKSRLGV